MANNRDSYSRGAENWRVGRKLNQQDSEHQAKYGYRGQDERQWGEGNYFHTGPSSHGAQDRPEHRYGESYQHDRNTSYAKDRNAHLNEHYGSKKNSPYRNESSYLDHGDQYQHSQQHNIRRPHYEGDNLQGSSQDRTRYQSDRFREGPSSRSRYKDDDFRYGSGSHNWYNEGRYTSDENRGPRDERGLFDKVKDTWNDIWHSDDPEYQPRNRYESRADRLDSHKRYGSEQYRDRGYNQGYEGGPRWADETDSGHDSYYNDTDRTKRYRR
jgi:hypothetical protein